MKFAEKKRLVKAQLRAHIFELLEKLGMDFDRAIFTDEEIRGETICHGGDNETGFVYYHNSGNWRCWTCHCHEPDTKDLVGLIMVCKNLDFWKAVEWANEFLDGIDVDSERVSKILQKRGENVRRVKDPEDIWKIHINQNTHSPKLLKSLSSAAPYLSGRGLDPMLCRKRQIGYAKKGKLCGRVVVPVYSAVGRIVGFSGRIVNEKQSPAKWKHFPSSKNKGYDKESSFKPGINLYNLNLALEAIQDFDNRTLIITEGPFDVIKLAMAGINNAVCCFGSHLHNGQIALMKKCGIEGVILAFDPDEAGEKATNKAKNALNRAMIECEIADLDHNDDVGSMSLEKVRKVFSNFVVGV